MPGHDAPTDGLLVVVDSPVHRLPAQTKVVAVVAVVAVVVLTPRGAWWVLAAQGALVALTATVARLPVRLVLRRLLVEAPFVVFAVLMPFVAEGPRVQVGPFSLSHAGLIGGGTVLVKATIGVLAAVVLAATTGPRELLAGLERLRLPAVLVAILSFMLRYVGVIADELHRVRVAREARGGGQGDRAGLAAVAGGVGTRFVRTYERGERVQQAMLARGYTGRMPALGRGGATTAQWALALVLPTAALMVLLVGLAMTVPR
ncbi:cobalt ECF transporter T component CbiQ [Actinotalea sp. M2MS4P-6]|uniref:cobalt ECF transporter T component CbiQ n=1 Tax=Actinotalea sp. M2MS4P-6 TaxID=2983762 RepID=UPI0021E37DB8|nr:cobalt ECF transporter T component CbiQ [Actinotalea sp. M2MS4P-6]MCV2392984.1 cobalt ECF transporter T component CbiQ [Actinotalea sp. M2MS4P-6]